MGSNRSFHILKTSVRPDFVVENGKLVEHWGVIDVGQMLAQLRLSPAA